METLEIKDVKATCIKIPNTVTSIDVKIFRCCYCLECIECDSDYYKSIDGVLFTADCKTLVCYPPKKKGTSYVVPDTVVNIKEFAFEDCRSLENIILPNSLISIGFRAFQRCKSLQRIVLPNSLADIQGVLFDGCSNLEFIECNSGSFKSINGVLFSATYKTLLCYPPKKDGASYIVPESVLDIAQSAFYGCESLENITLPDSLEDIGWYAFNGCNSLENIILPNSLTRIGEGAFSFCKSLQNIELPNSLIRIEKYAFRFCSSLREINLPDSVVEMGIYVFESCRRLRNIKLSTALTDIPEGAFYDCGKLKEVILPGSIKHIGKDAFRRCESLVTIKLPNSIQCIEENVFSGCQSLQEIKLPDNIVSINRGAFGGCKSLETIKLPNSIQCIGDNAFQGCGSLETIECDNERYQTIDGVLFDREEKRCLCYPNGKIGRKYVIPDGTLVIGRSAFYGCRELEEITLPDSVRTIESEAFGSCLGLKSIKLPNQVDLIEPSVFDGCFHLTHIECDSSFFKSIDGVLFTADCKTLVCYPEGKGCENYVIPDSVLNIADGAFHSLSDYFCSTSCKSITIPKSMNEITNTIFKDHESLKRIECDSDYYKSIDGVLFTADCKTLVCYPRGREDSQYTIPDSVVSIKKDAFESSYSLLEIIVPNGSLEKFKQMLPEEIWEKLKEL